MGADHVHTVQCGCGQVFDFDVRKIVEETDDGRTVLRDHEATGSTACPRCGTETGHITVSIAEKA